VNYFRCVPPADRDDVTGANAEAVAHWAALFIEALDHATAAAAKQ
jgi:hypothetical protein